MGKNSCQFEIIILTYNLWLSNSRKGTTNTTFCLDFAIAEGNVEVVRIVIKRKDLLLNQTTRFYGMPPMNLAAIKGN